MLKSLAQVPLIADGDLVIFYISPQDIFGEVMRASESVEIHNRLGRFPHKDIIGKPFGSKIFAANPKSKDLNGTEPSKVHSPFVNESTSYMYALKPTTDLWTRVLPHRTQIIYHADMAWIIHKLQVRTGSTVVESGSGSGSFTHNLAKAVGSKGHLYTFEFHAERAAAIQKQIIEHGMGQHVTASHRNVCKDGFGLNNLVDVVFLDLPSPWDAIPHAKQALKSNTMTRICSYSPCIEQIQRTIKALDEAGFTHIQMFTALMRDWDVRQVNLAGFPEVKQIPIGIGSKRPLRSPAFNLNELEDSTLIAQPKMEMRGHTSFLLFAELHLTIN